MARKRSTILNDLYEIAQRTPPLLSCCIAIGSYILFHNFATNPTIGVPNADNVSQSVVGAMIKGASTGLQYIIPFIFLLGAFVAFLKVKRGQYVATQYVKAAPIRSSEYPQPKPAQQIHWQDFELLVGEAFRRQGYRVIDGGDQGADGGVDVRLSKDGKSYLVQCKHWQTQRVGVTVVRELLGVMTAERADGGFIVTSGDYTPEATALAASQSITLINGHALDKLLRTNMRSIGYPTAPAKVGPCCPRCNSSMVKRKATRGTHKGTDFWGCSRFPQCKGIVRF